MINAKVQKGDSEVPRSFHKVPEREAFLPDTLETFLPLLANSNSALPSLSDSPWLVTRERVVDGIGVHTFFLLSKSECRRVWAFFLGLKAKADKDLSDCPSKQAHPRPDRASPLGQSPSRPRKCIFLPLNRYRIGRLFSELTQQRGRQGSFKGHKAKDKRKNSFLDMSAFFE